MSDVISLPFRDQAARERIGEDLETNLLVEAGAGSGKTTALVGRMVALVERGVAKVDEIAAVTFTRKAASELRERFQIRLEERLAEARAGEEDELVRDRLADALDEVDRVFIGTIHAFCARLLRERPMEVGLDPAFEELAVDERIRVRDQFWEAYLERLTRDADPILEELATAGLATRHLKPLFGNVVENLDVDFPVTDAALPTADEIREVRAEMDSLVDEGWELMPDHEPPKSWDSLQKKMRRAHFLRAVTEWKEPADFFEALEQLCKSGTRGHQITLYKWKNPDLAKALRAKVDAFGVGDTRARRLLARWLAHRYALVIRLVRRAAEEFEMHRIRTGRVDFQDLLVLTARLLREHPDVRTQLGRRYRRLLVDEFQDTDPLQAEIMMLLASDGEEVDWRAVEPRPGALFVVGDPKQSIYRFRRADIQLYGFVKRRFADFGQVLELTTNFRSRPPIGDLVNERFAGPEFFPDEATEEQASFEPLNTRPVPEGGHPGRVVWYAISGDRSTRDGVTEEDADRIASHIAERVAGGERSPGDFLILTRKRSHLSTYARALEARSLPLQVTGAGVGAEHEIRELEVLIECMIDPANPVKVAAVLVGLFFGLDYERLVQHKLEGGRFDLTAKPGAGHADVLAALTTLRSWWRTARNQPADIFVTSAVSELGLLPYAAAGELGALRAGALVYALDAVRAAARGGDASLPGALAALRSALDLSEAEAPLEPGQPDVVRLMNLHQAKGLEAKVVFLADPTGASRRKPDRHMTRSEGGEAVGFLSVTQATSGFGGDAVLARPEGWDAREEAEERFDAAEEVRLLYVAVTRAAEELYVARWPKKPKSSPWAALDPWLEERAEELELPIVEPGERERLEISADDLTTAAARTAEARARAGRPTLEFRSVTELAKDVRPEPAPDPVARPAEKAQPDSGYRGYSWGSAVHGALAAAADGVTGEALRGACRDLLVDNGRPLDDHGDPRELDELLGVVEAVTSSDLWARAHRADRVLSEVPFASVHAVDPPEAEFSEDGSAESEPARRQLDLFGMAVEESGATAPDSAPEPGDPGAIGPSDASDPGDEEPRVVLEGVVDLVFREKGGWVIADYKTDVGTDPDFPNRVAGYRRQVDLYAEAWSRLTGEPVKERVLFYTAQDRVESW